MHRRLLVAAGLAAAILAGACRDADDAGSPLEPRGPDLTIGGAPCASPRPEWVFCDDFEVNRLARYFEYAAASGSFVRAAGVGRGGSVGMRARYRTGQVNAGALHLAFGRTPQSYFRPADAGTANYRDLYFRYWLRYQPGWTGGGGMKIARSTIFASSTSWAQAMAGHVWSGGTGNQYLVLDPASGTDASGVLKTTSYGDSKNFRWLGSAKSVTPVFQDRYAGRWLCIEYQVRLNTPGYSDGTFRLWIDGRAEAARTGLNWVGKFTKYGINAFFVENYWNSGSPKTQERYFDDVIVSRTRIGC